MTSSEIRQQFIDFFVQKHGHAFVASSPVVPHDDPTLLFTNAGMNQFKPYFLGQEKAPWPRVANTQKCIRAGGKHNDLDDVGRSRRHHTFFEMLGNWSFGDYFKHGAIEMAWELLTSVWKLDRERLHVSCYEGNPTAGIPRDTEAADIWKQVAGMADDHIHFFGKDNFWEMGDTGPCGPCTEIYYDRRPLEEIEADRKTGRRAPVNGEDPRVMEIWNNVFMQYNRDASGKLTTLPAQHVDTGMGLERICQVLQGKDDNFATDLWSPLFVAITKLSGITYTGKFPKTNAGDPVAEAADAQLRHDIAFRVVADHIRCLTFALTDGAVPSNEGRGYVLRRILRRAVRFGRQQLGLNEPFLHRLVPEIVESMSNAFPELKKNPARVVELVKGEEESFGRTLDRGIQLFDDAAEAGNISAADAFKLHDTYGFPIDLTRIMAEERGMTVDIAGYEKLMEQAKELARSGGKENKSKVGDLPPAVLAKLAEVGVRPTDDQPKYSHEPLSAKIMAVWDGENLTPSPGVPEEGVKASPEVPEASEATAKACAADDRELAIILDRTNFYAEMGGQVGDTGELKTASGGVFAVESTKVVGGYVLQIGRVTSGSLRAGDTVVARVATRREQTEKNHTTTHIANWALREVLGDDVQQKGSLVDPDKLRFDFSHGKSLSDEELARVETLVNEGIAKQLPVYAETAAQEQALKIHGLRAVFGEKYPPMVRVVSVGVPVKELLADPANPKWRQYSVEFCGGTHLGNAGSAEAFALTAEESVSKGIRRIVGLTGDAAKTAVAAAAQMDAISAQAKAAKDESLPALIADLQKAITGTLPLRAKRRAQATTTELQARFKAHEKAVAKAGGGGANVDVNAITVDLLAKATDLGGGKLVVGEVPGAGDEQLRAVSNAVKKKIPNVAALLASVLGEKVTLVALVSDELVAKGLKAGDWIKEASKITGGGGGGRPQMAQGSGGDLTKLAAALASAAAYATSKVGS